MIDLTLVKRKIVVDSRGKIKSGKKNKATGLPMKLDYFNIQKFDELLDAYGDKPNKMIVFFPSNEIAENIKYDFIKWGKSRKEGAKGIAVRVCNGTRCVHRISETVCDRSFGAGEESECICKTMQFDPNNKDHQKLMCKADVRVFAYIYCPNVGDFEIPIAYQFETHSKSSGDNVISHMLDIRNQYGQLIGVPFILSVSMYSKADDPSSTYPVWSLQIFGRKSQIVKQLAAVKEASGAFMMLSMPAISADGEEFKQDQGGVEIESESEDPEIVGIGETIIDPQKQREADLEFAFGSPPPMKKDGKSSDPAPKIAPAKVEVNAAPPSGDEPEVYTRLLAELNALDKSRPDIVSWKNRNDKEINKIPEGWRKQLLARLNVRIEEGLPF